MCIVRIHSHQLFSVRHKIRIRRPSASVRLTDNAQYILCWSSLKSASTLSCCYNFPRHSTFPAFKVTAVEVYEVVRENQIWRSSTSVDHFRPRIFHTQFTEWEKSNSHRENLHFNKISRWKPFFCYMMPHPSLLLALNVFSVRIRQDLRLITSPETPSSSASVFLRKSNNFRARVVKSDMRDLYASLWALFYMCVTTFYWNTKFKF